MLVNSLCSLPSLLHLCAKKNNNTLGTCWLPTLDCMLHEAGAHVPCRGNRAVCIMLWPASCACAATKMCTAAASAPLTMRQRASGASPWTANAEDVRARGRPAVPCGRAELCVRARRENSRAIGGGERRVQRPAGRRADCAEPAAKSRACHPNGDPLPRAGASHHGVPLRARERASRRVLHSALQEVVDR